MTRYQKLLGETNMAYAIEELVRSLQLFHPVCHVHLPEHLQGRKGLPEFAVTQLPLSRSHLQVCTQL